MIQSWFDLWHKPKLQMSAADEFFLWFPVVVVVLAVVLVVTVRGSRK